VAKETAVLDELAQQVRDLQQEVKDLGGGGVLAVGMFQRVSPMLLDIEAFILDFPAQSSSFICQCSDIVGRHRQVADPLEAGRAGLTVHPAGFETLKDRQRMLAVL